MRLIELFETTQDDREISEITKKLYKYVAEKYSDLSFDGEETSVQLGTLYNIGIVEDDSLFRNVNIRILSPDRMWKESYPGEPYDPYKSSSPMGAWDSELLCVDLNSDYMNSNGLKTTISHELRHGLDSIKSNHKANYSKSYSTPKNKKHRSQVDDQDTPYLAQPSEINARVMEVQHELDKIVSMIYNAKAISPEGIKARILKAIKELLSKYQISNLFPEKEKSTQYKRIIKRIMAYTQELMKDQETRQPKVAQGNW